MIRFRTSAFSLLALVGLSACASTSDPVVAEDEGPVDETSSNLTLQYPTWPRSANGTTLINVCFAAQAKQAYGFTAIPGFTPGPGEGPGYKDAIIDAIQDGWGRAANLRINFFDDCPSNTNGWVVIHFNEHHVCGTTPPSAECSDLGYRGGNVPNNIWLNQNEGQAPNPPSTFNHHQCGSGGTQPKPTSGGSSYDSLEELRQDALHEFGHTLGFAHNFLDPDVPADVVAGCKKTSTGTKDGEYDYGSVMDYCTKPCNTDSFGNTRGYFHARLSDFDIWGAQKVYGNKRATGPVIVGHRNHVIEVPASNAYNGAPLQVFDYAGGVNEQWYFELAANRISTRLNATLDWDARGPKTPQGGTPILLSPEASVSTQVITYDAVEWRGTGDNCLTAVNNTAGSKVELRRCTRSGNQSWKVSYGSIGGARFQLTGTNLCVVTPSSSPSIGQDVTLADCASAGVRSNFRTAGGALQFVGTSSTLCLDTEVGDPTGAVIDTGSSPRSLDTYDPNFFPTRAGRTLQLFSCKTSAPDNLNQQFHLHGVINGANNQCVDIQGGIGKNGAAVQMFACHGGPNQQWDAYVF